MSKNSLPIASSSCASRAISTWLRYRSEECIRVDAFDMDQWYRSHGATICDWGIALCNHEENSPNV